MIKSFFNSKFGRTLVALAVGGIAPAVPQLLMGDVHAFRVAASAAAGAVCTAVALRFKSQGDA